MRSRYLAEVVLLTCVLLWGFNVTVTKTALAHGFAPLSYGVLRFGIATAVMVAIVLWRQRVLFLPRRHLRHVLLWGGLAICLNQLGFMYSFRYASASTISLLFGTLPIFAGIFAQFAGFERLTARRWFAAGVSFGGVALIAVAESGVSGSTGGIVIALFAPFSFAAYSIALAPLVREYGTVRVNPVVSLCALVPLAIVSLPTLAHTDWGEVTPLAWVCLLYSAIPGYALANLFWFLAVDRVGAPRASMFANLQPFVGALFAVLILNEPLQGLQWVGGALIAAGIVLSQLGSAHGKETARIEAEAAPHE